MHRCYNKDTLTMGRVIPWTNGYLLTIYIFKQTHLREGISEIKQTLSVCIDCIIGVLTMKPGTRWHYP